MKLPGYCVRCPAACTRVASPLPNSLIRRRALLQASMRAVVLQTCLALCASVAHAAPTKKPHLLFMMADQVAHSAVLLHLETASFDQLCGCFRRGAGPKVFPSSARLRAHADARRRHELCAPGLQDAQPRRAGCGWRSFLEHVRARTCPCPCLSPTPAAGPSTACRQGRDLHLHPHLPRELTGTPPRPRARPHVRES